MKRVAGLILSLIILLSFPAAFIAEDESTGTEQNAEMTKQEIVEEFKNGLQIGTWVSYVVDEEATKTMRENGIDFAFLSFDESRDLQTIEMCEKYDIKCILRDWDLFFHGGGENLQIPTLETFQTRLSDAVISNPAVIGHLLVDEPVIEGLVKVGEGVDLYKSVNTELIPFVNLYPNVVYNTEKYLEYLDLFIKETENDYISFDIYPLRSTNMTQNNYYNNLNQVSKAAKANNIDYWIFIQSMPLGDRCV